MNNQDNLTIRQIIDNHADEIPQKDLEYCLIDCLKKNRSFVKFNPTYILNNKELIDLKKLIFELRSGKPLSYVLGYHPFYKHEFYVDKNVLIPRNETEIIIDEILKAGDIWFNNYNKLNFTYFSKTLLDNSHSFLALNLSFASSLKFPFSKVI